jgi:hypothetical protein
VALEAMPGPLGTVTKLIRETVGLLGMMGPDVGAPVGKGITDGVAKGVSDGRADVKAAVSGVAGDVKSTFADSLQIRSPSAVFAKFGEHTVEGYEQGVERGSPGAQGAVAAMVSPPTAGGGARGGSAPIVINVTIQASGAGREAAEAVSAPDVLQQITRALTDGLRGAGIPVPA